MDVAAACVNWHNPSELSPELAKRAELLCPRYYRGTKLKIIFNGFPEEMEGCGLTIQELLDRSQEDDPAVIVEVNGRFIYRKEFKTFQLKDSDKVEFIHPSFGG